MIWYPDTEIEETWAYDPKLDKMILVKNKTVRRGDVKSKSKLRLNRKQTK